MIEVNGLTKTFGTTVAVRDLTFRVEPGRVTGFLGPNGAGKSTTMRCMLELDRPDTGRCTFNGHRLVDVDQPLREVGALLDAKYAHPTRSARNHLRYLAVSNRLPEARVDECLELVGLSEVARKRVGGFSLGMMQRLGLAAALLGDPGTLLFDEPVNGLDPDGIIWIRHFMRYLAGQGRTVLVSSHLLSEMSQTADDLVVIGRGELISQGPVKQFVERTVGSWVRVRSPAIGQLTPLLSTRGGQLTPRADGAIDVAGLTSEAIGELAAANAIVLHELSPQSGSLEDAFLEATKGSLDYHAGLPTRGPVPGPPTGVPPGQAFPAPNAPNAPSAPAGQPHGGPR